MAYLTIISEAPNNWTALTPELSCIGTAKTKEALLRQASEAIALALEDDQQRAARITSLEQLDADIRAELPAGHEFVFLEPAPLNPVSAQIEQALKVAGINQSELARRLGTTRSAVSRMVNPFYWGHNVDTLRRVAEVLNATLRVEITVKAS